MIGLIYRSRFLTRLIYWLTGYVPHKILCEEIDRPTRRVVSTKAIGYRLVKE